MTKNVDRFRLLWLDVLRGLAILMVVLFHFTVRYAEKHPLYTYPEPAAIRIHFGWIGVHLFFMISGFIIYMTIQKKQGPVHFLTARLSRLVPPYWAAIALVLGLASLYRSTMGDDQSASVAVILANLAMVPDLLHYESLDGAYWSLYVELKFYVIFATIWAFFDLKSRRNFFFSFGLILAVTILHNNFHPILFGQEIGYFPIFWTGIAAYKLLHEGLSLWIYAAIASVTTASTLGYYSAGPELLVGIPVFALLFAIAENVFAAHPPIERLLSPLATLGRVSYSYYLVHQPIGYLVLGLLAVTALNFNLAIVVAMLTCFMFALLGFTFVEQLDKPIGKSLFAAYTRFATRVGIDLR